jgi:hypothetical protein
MFFRVMCEWFTSDTAFYAFGRCSFGLCVNGLRLIPHFMRSDGFFWVICKYFTPDTVFYLFGRCSFGLPDTVFYWFGRCSFGLCVHGLRLTRCFIGSDGILLGCVCMVYA